MSTTPDKPGADDERWLDALAGRAAPGEPDATAFEAQMWRKALAAMREPAVAPLSAESEQALLDQLLKAAAASPKTSICPACAQRWAALLGWLSARPLQIATVAGLGLLFAVGLRPPTPAVEDAPVERAAPQSRIVLLRDAQPRQRRDALAQQLGAAGATVRRYERLGRYGLDAQFTLPLAGEATRLHELGLAPDPDGVLRVEVEEAAP